MNAVVVALDPMLTGGLKWTPLLIVVVKVLAIFAIGLVATMFMVWYERKVIAGLQNRIGPNKAGPFGLLQTLADGIKLIFKEDFLPNRADRIVYRLAPFLAFVPAFLVWSVIPLGGDFSDGNGGVVTWFGHPTTVQLADPPIGILLVLALSSIAVYGVMLAGWSSGSKYPLLGAVRASAQMVSYEAALGLSVASVLLFSGTLSTSGIVAGQDSIVRWNIVTTVFVPFVIFIVAATAELNRPPFDLVEAEQELVGGFNTEYAAFGFALFFLAEFMNAVTMSGVIVTLFLYMFVWFRATLPRLRYDQLMDLGWKVMIPASLGWFLFLAANRVFVDRGWDWPARVAGIAVVVVGLGLAALLMMLALRVARRRREALGGAF